MDLNDKIVKDENDSAFHSNGFATVSNGARVGAASTETFEQRKRRELHRTIISGYQTSNIGRPFAAAAQAKPVPLSSAQAQQPDASQSNQPTNL